MTLACLMGICFCYIQSNKKEYIPYICSNNFCCIDLLAWNTKNTVKKHWYEKSVLHTKTIFKEYFKETF